jgi:hypothetical protein
MACKTTNQAVAICVGIDPQRGAMVYDHCPDEVYQGVTPVAHFTDVVDMARAFTRSDLTPDMKKAMFAYIAERGLPIDDDEAMDLVRGMFPNTRSHWVLDAIKKGLTGDFSRTIAGLLNRWYDDEHEGGGVTQTRAIAFAVGAMKDAVTSSIAGRNALATARIGLIQDVLTPLPKYEDYPTDGYWGTRSLGERPLLSLDRNNELEGEVFIEVQTTTVARYAMCNNDEDLTSYLNLIVVAMNNANVGLSRNHSRSLEKAQIAITLADKYSDGVVAVYPSA